MSNPNQAPAPQPIDDLVNIDAQGRAHRPDGHSRENSGFMTNHEVGLIEANQDLIRDGLDGHDTYKEKFIADRKAELEPIADLVDVNVNGLATRDGGKLISADNVEQIKKRQNDIRKAYKGHDSYADKFAADEQKEHDRMMAMAEIADIVRVTEDGKALRPEGHSRKNSGYMTTKEVDVIKANQQDIRDSLGGHDTVAEFTAAAALPLAEQSAATRAAVLKNMLKASANVNPQTGQTSRDRKSIREMMGAAKSKLKEMYTTGVGAVVNATNRGTEALTPEQTKTRRRMVNGAVIGAIGVASAVVAFKVGGFDSFTNGSNQFPQAGGEIDPASSGKGAIIEAGTVAGVPEESLRIVEPAAEVVQRTDIMNAGENPWANATDQLHDGATNAQIDRLTDRTMELNNWTNDKQIPVGQYQIPYEMIEQINKEIDEAKAA